MIKISEFTPAITSNREHTATAQCKVIINNETLRQQPEFAPPPVVARSPELVEPIQETVEYNHVELYKHLAISFSNILKSNNLKLVANLIDMSGKVVLSARDLCKAITLIVNADEHAISIEYEDPDASCMTKVNPVKTISNIKVNGYDFRMAYNRYYNILSDEFNVSLTRCLIF